MIAFGRSIVVENNYGYTGPREVPPSGPSRGTPTTEPGVTRIVVDYRRGTCHKAWSNRKVRVPSSVSKASTATGLVYVVEHPAADEVRYRSGEKPATGPQDPWYLTALDARTGKRVWSVLTGTDLSLGVVTFALCQAIAFWWIPEGLLRGRNAGVLVTGNEAASSFIAEWARIAAFNLMILLLFYVGANLMRFRNGVPLGYLTVIVMQVYFGIITGTNSFTMPEEGKIAPSFYWLITPGFYELAAYALAAVATYEISMWQDVRINGRTRAVRIHPSEGGWRSPPVGWGLAVAMVALVASNAWEASNIIGR